MDEQGKRTPDANLCIHSEQALQVVSSNALRLARQLQPTTSRYFLWGDDGQPWCRCPSCAGSSIGIRRSSWRIGSCVSCAPCDPSAQLAHLAYANTITPPKRVKPAPGAFLEFAPIRRRYDVPYAEQTGTEAKDALTSLSDNLQVFPADSAQVLEYWLDVSRFSDWKRPAVSLPWNKHVITADAATYARLGIRNVTTFAVWIDADYVRRFGEPAAVQGYGDASSGQQITSA